LGKTDSSKLFLKFCTLPDSAIRRVYQNPWLVNQYPILLNGPLEIEANEIKTFNEASLPTSHKSLIGLSPHSHHVCVSWTVRMVTSPGDTTNLIHIPQWSFDWQYYYLLTKVIEIPSGAIMLGEAVFDNTSNNPDNPNDPPQFIHEGEHSDNEMMRCYFLLMDYQPGDEDIILDSSFYGFPVNEDFPGALNLRIYPNPSGDIFHLTSDLPSHDVNWELTDIFGNRVRSMNLKNAAKGIYVENVDVSRLPSGIYQLSIQSGGYSEVKRVMVIR
jgi:hypothetical protein